MRIPCSAFALLALVLSPGAFADDITLTPDRDNTLYGEDGTLSNGAGNSLFSGRTAVDTTRRALLHFDLSGIPDGATIQSVSLRLTMDKTISGARDVSLHRATRDWGEGSSHASGQEGGGAPATPGDATWTFNFFSSSMWTLAGGDFVGSPSATTSVAGNGNYTWTGPGLVADLQAWVDDPAQNFGWLLKHDDETSSATAKRFGSRQETQSSKRPELTVVFDPPCGVVFCEGPNQLGSIGVDTCDTTAGSINLTATGVTGGLFAYYIVSDGTGIISDPPGSTGDLCLAGGGPIGRYSQDLEILGGTGSFSTDIWNSITGGPGGGLPNPPGGAIVAGDTWNFQGWARVSGGSRWTPAVSVTFQ